MRDIDKYRGCMIGGAVGDTLGYIMEFQPEDGNINRYGNSGICGYVFDPEGVTRFSNDIQMTRLSRLHFLR